MSISSRCGGTIDGFYRRVATSTKYGHWPFRYVTQKRPDTWWSYGRIGSVADHT